MFSIIIVAFYIHIGLGSVKLTSSYFPTPLIMPRETLTALITACRTRDNHTSPSGNGVINY